MEALFRQQRKLGMAVLLPGKKRAGGLKIRQLLYFNEK
jgi:hypothetical protein